MPLWIVFGYWDHYTCLFVYSNIESEEALEMHMILDEVIIEINDDTEDDKKEFRVASIPATIWHATSPEQRDEWSFILESARKTR